MKKLSLKGQWQLVRQSTGKVISAVVPGDIYSAHLEAGEIDDPYWECNEDKVRWLGEEAWIYKRKFRVFDEMLEDTSVFLHFDCLDTLGQVFINGQLAGTTDNMFRRYRFKVKPFLRPGENEVAVHFDPVAPEAARRAEAHPFPVPSQAIGAKVPHLNHIRKAQCHGGWDWGPSLMTAGIYENVFIASTSRGRLESVTMDQHQEKQEWTLTFDIEYLGEEDQDEILKIDLGPENLEVSVPVKRGINHFSRSITLQSPKLWWPAGYGTQNLYSLEVSLGEDVFRQRVGIRKVELIREEILGEEGSSLYFKVNGQKIFCKGANWIPMDAMPGKVTTTRYNRLLNSVVEANMNMLRVWGGGSYEVDHFYELCDEKGILVWQDMMFACSLYPSDEAFLENVKEEVTYQVKRLKNHPSLILWCGDNEILMAMEWYTECRTNPDLYYDSFIRLNQGVVSATVAELDPGRPYWLSSPCSGSVRGDVDLPHTGDIHYWDVWKYGLDFDAFHQINPRFCSETGFQSFPSLETVKQFAPEEERDIYSPVMLFHQRHPEGNQIIRKVMESYFPAPEDFASQLWMSQLLQGVAVTTAAEYWRSLMPYCMGFLYWQLNDVWPVSSWSSIEYGGKWKLLHYMIKRSFQPLIVTAHQTEKSIAVKLVNDDRRGYNVRITTAWYRFNGELMEEERQEFRIEGVSAGTIEEYSLEAYNPRDCFLFMSVENTDKPGDLCHRNVFFPAKFKDCAVEKSGIKVYSYIRADQIYLRLSAAKPAFFVSLDAGDLGGEFSDNSFHLMPGEEKEVTFYEKGDVPLNEFQRKLTVRDLSSIVKENKG